jgi:hypothetical protein
LGQNIGWKTVFWVKKNLISDFPVTTIAGIWKKRQNIVHVADLKKKMLGGITCFPPKLQKKNKKIKLRA